MKGPRLVLFPRLEYCSLSPPAMQCPGCMNFYQATWGHWSLWSGRFLSLRQEPEASSQVKSSGTEGSCFQFVRSFSISLTIPTTSSIFKRCDTVLTSIHHMLVLDPRAWWDSWRNSTATIELTVARTSRFCRQDVFQ